MKSVVFNWNNRAHRKKIVRIIESGKVVAGSSDTVPGLLVKPTKEGKKLLDSLKNRSNKPYLLLLGSKPELDKFISSETILQIEKLIDKCWPGPLTLILKVKSNVPEYMKSEQGTIAVRIPDHPGLLVLLAETGPLFSTSANESGAPVPKDIDAIDSSIKDTVNALVYNGPAESQSSTIVDWTNTVPHVVREGAYPVEKLEKFLGFTLQRDS